MLEEQIQMVDLHGQYLRFKEEIDEAMQVVIDSCAFQWSAGENLCRAFG